MKAKEFAWTEPRIRTLRLALNLAYMERVSFLDANRGDAAMEKRIRSEMARLRKLQRDALGEETMFERKAAEDRAAPTVSILALRKGGA